MVITLEEETKKKHMALSSTDTRLAQCGNVEDDERLVINNSTAEILEHILRSTNADNKGTIQRVCRTYKGGSPSTLQRRDFARTNALYVAYFYSYYHCVLILIQAINNGSDGAPKSPFE